MTTLGITDLSILTMESSTAKSRLSHLDIPPPDAKIPVIVPVGLNFGPIWLSITFFIDQDEFYTPIPCGELYQSFFQYILRKEVQCGSGDGPSERLSTSAVPYFTSQEKAMQLVQTISEHIKSAISMGASALDNNPALRFKVMAVTVPDHWGEAARRHVATASRLAGHPLDGSHMIIPLSRAIQSAFQLSRMAQSKYLTLLIDYNKSYLHLMLVEMCWKACVVKGQVYFTQFGEDELHKAPISGSAVASDQERPTQNVVSGKPIDGSHNEDEGTSNLSTRNSSSDDLIFPINDLHTVGLPIRERLTSNSSTTNPSPINAPSSDNVEKSAAVPDEFYTQRPVCHNQATHFKPILDAVCNFMLVMTAPEVSSPAKPALDTSHNFMVRWKTPETSNPARDLPRGPYKVGEVRQAVRDLKYIVIDGEASIPGLMDLKNMIERKFVNEDWITVLGTKRDCGAYGAALAARRQLQNPKHVGDWKDLPGYVP